MSQSMRHERVASFTIPRDAARQLSTEWGRKNLIRRDAIPDVVHSLFGSILKEKSRSSANYIVWREAVIDWQAAMREQWKNSSALAQALSKDHDDIRPLPWDLKDLERLRIQDAVKAFGARETKKEVAARLGISAFTLGKKLKKYDLTSPWERRSKRK